MARCQPILTLVCLVAHARASRCNGKAQPGPRNANPVDVAPPVFIKSVPNGKLYTIGQGSDTKDLLHLWGNPYENGVAMGQLIGPKIDRFIPEVYRYMETQIIPNLGNTTWCAERRVRCDGLREALKLGLTAALNLSFHVTAPFIKPYVLREIEGLATATSLGVVMLRNIMWLGELTRGACSMFGATGSATADGRLLQLRALDWDVDGPFKNFATVTVYHPRSGEGHAFANVGFAGFTGSVTGFSSARLGVSEIGVSYPDASFGPETYLAPGYPFGFLLRDALQFDNSLAEATARIQDARRTCDLILGVGDGASDDFSGFQFSPSVATVIKPSNLLPRNASWHPPIKDIVYWGMDWVCPNDNRMLAEQLRKHHGQLTAELTAEEVVSYVGTGDLHVAIYDYPRMQMLLATARPDSGTGPLPAYQRQFTRLDMVALFNEQPPSGLAPQPLVAWSAPGSTCPEVAAVLIDHEDSRQTIGGFGASLTESSAINLNALPRAQQEALLALCFGAGAGAARLSAVKTTMLANDFAAAAPWSTYDDVAGDEALAHFSIARDEAPNGSLTLLRRAQAAGFDGTVQAYMDYPPARTSRVPSLRRHKLASRWAPRAPPLLALPPEPPVVPPPRPDWMLQGALPDNATVAPQLYAALALYFAKYVAAYAARGVTIDFVEAFNEPTDSYTRMSAAQLAAFLGEHLGPAFDALGLRPRTRLTYGGQAERWRAAEVVPQVMADPRARRYMDVIAYHGYDCQFNCSAERENYAAIATLAAAYPGVPLWMTEICYAYNGDDPNCASAATLPRCVDYPRNASLAPPLPRTDFADGATWGERLVRELQAGASGWIYWNLFLDTLGGPFNLSPRHNDGPQNYQHPLIIVDAAAGAFRPTGLFRFLAHFSRYVRPGAVRLGTAERALPAGVSAVAFRAPQAQARAGEEAVLQLVNRATVARSVAVCSRGHVAEVVLPPTSITTATWKVGSEVVEGHVG